MSAPPTPSGAVLAKQPPSRQPKTRVPADNVRRALATDPEARADAMVRFRRSGGDLDRWGPSDAKRMAEAITLAEDGLEHRRSTPARDVARVALRDVRRQLEWEVAT
jgi:hypothetical protein